MRLNQKGFTLLEVLIALFIFAILGVIVSMGLRRIIRTSAHIKKIDQEVSAWQMAMVLWERDVSQMAPKQLKNSAGETLPVLVGREHVLAFTRGGLLNPLLMQNRSTLARVGYRLENHQLIRSVWPHLNQQKGDWPIPTVLLSHIQSLSFQYVDEHNVIQTHWPLSTKGGKSHPSTWLPKAVLLTLTTEDGYQLTRLVALPFATPHTQKDSA